MLQTKGSNSDRLISFKKTAAQASLIQHHNILQESIPSFIHLTTSRTCIIVCFWKHLCDHEFNSIHQHSGFALGSYQSYIYIYIYNIINKYLHNIHAANLEISRYAEKNAPDSSGIWHEQEYCFCFVFVFESESALVWVNHWFIKPFIKTVIWFAPEGFSRFERIVWMTVIQ